MEVEYALVCHVPHLMTSTYGLVMHGKYLPQSAAPAAVTVLCYTPGPQAVGKSVPPAQYLPKGQGWHVSLTV